MSNLTARVLASFLSLGIGCAARQKIVHTIPQTKPTITCANVLKAEALESPESIVELVEYKECTDKGHSWTERINDYSLIDLDEDGHIDIIAGQGSFTASRYPCSEGIYMRNGRKEEYCFLPPLVWERAQNFFEEAKPREKQENKDKPKLKFIYDRSM